MSFKYRWKPSKAMKAAYHQKMLAIEEAKNKLPDDSYSINSTGDCVTGDEIAFFNAGKSSERLYGIITHESYGIDKQQHTFTIETNDGAKMLIKGRNLYRNGVLRKPWQDENKRQTALDEKHERGNVARKERLTRKQNLQTINDYYSYE